MRPPEARKGHNGFMSTAQTPPRRIYSFPHWTDNPFVNLLYVDAQSQGWQVVGSRLLEHFVRLVSESTLGDVIHVHWTAPIVQRGKDADDAAQRRTVFEEAITQARTRGTTVVWSIHNVVPHDASFLDEELALARFLSDASSRIHILSSRTREIVADRYSLDPAALVRVPHSSYWGVYDQSVSRAEARDHFGLSESDVVVGFLGQLRPYKGVDTLIRAIELLQRTHPSVVLMLGGKTHPDHIEAFDRLVAPLTRVIRSHTFVADDELPLWMRAFDIMALPYRSVLNSGSIALAATYGVPVVTPEQAGFAADFAEESWVTTYDAGAGAYADADADDDADGGAEALADGLRRRFQAGMSTDASAVSWARSYTPFEMSKAFTDAVLHAV